MSKLNIPNAAPKKGAPKSSRKKGGKFATLALLVALTLSSCGDKNFPSVDSLKGKGYTPISNFTFETEHKFTHNKDTISLDGVKVGYKFMGSEKTYVRDGLKSDYGITLEDDSKLPGKFIATYDETGESISYYISEEGFMFYEGDDDLAKKTFEIIVKVGTDRTMSTFTQTLDIS